LENQDSRRRWGTDQRLEFIEFRLFWHGDVSRGDLTSYFGVSVPQASNDLALYKELAEENIRYDTSRKRYVPTQEFQPKFMKPNADNYLTQLKAISDGVIGMADTWIADAPAFDALPIPSRRIDPYKLRILLKGVREHRSIEIYYQSMNPARQEAIWRRITPHAFSHDGFRWHVRAFCHETHKFKDFIISRCRDLRDEGEPGAAPADDIQWHSFFDVVLEPNPDLTESQRRTIALDYNMPDGRATIPVRCALLYYFEKRLRLDVDARKDTPAEKPVVVANWKEFVKARNAAGA
jgi:hypothetical protein